MSIGGTVGMGLVFPLLNISLQVEVGEHDEEHSAVEEYDVTVVFRKITVYEQWEGGVNKESSELHQLHCSQISRNKQSIIIISLSPGEI